MKFRYIGEYPEGQQSLECYGIVFTPGAELEIQGKFASKAMGNRFFEEVKDNPEREEDPESSDSSKEDGSYDPFKGMSRDDLIAMAEDKGIKIDKRWGDAKIIEVIGENEL